MADSVDRVFAQALRTVRRLPRPGSTRPPPSARLRLYGLYKQSMEGDVEAIPPRPSLPHTPSGTTNDADDDGGVGQSQLKREREAKAGMEKRDAWHACAGLSRTEAKRRYIEVLIQTMKIYAAGTAEARELVDELEFVWNQIRSQSGSEGSLRNTGRAGVGIGELPPGEDGEGRLRVLSPVSRGGSGEIVEGEDASIPEREPPDGEEEDDDDDDGDDEDLRDGPPHGSEHAVDRGRQPSPDTRKWRRRIETALTKISTEMAALREQMDELNSTAYERSGLSVGRRRDGRKVLAWMRWILWIAVRQLAADGLVLAVFLLWGVGKGDDRFERWIGRRWGQLRRLVEGLKGRWYWNWAGIVVRAVPARFL